MATQVFFVQDPGLSQLLEQNNLTQVGDILQHSVLDLSELLNLNHSACRVLQDAASRQIAPRPVTAMQLYQAITANQSARVLTGLPDLDTALRGGLPPGAITELVGPSSVGKTQFCMNAVVQSVAPAPYGRQRSVIYIDTERKFSLDRLKEVAVARLAASFQETRGQHSAGLPPDPEQALAAMLDRVKLMYPGNADQLLHSLFSLEANIEPHNAALVVVDSIAALIRTSGDTGNSKVSMTDRAETLGQAASCLKTAAERFQIPVLVTNQVGYNELMAAFTNLQCTKVSARIGSGTSGHDFQGAGPGFVQATTRDNRGGGGSNDDSGQQVSAALGTAWAHSVNVRITLERLANQRLLQLIKSPASPNIALEYQIMTDGVRQVGQAMQALTQGSVLQAGMFNVMQQETWKAKLDES